jgi:hypothetical protein
MTLRGSPRQTEGMRFLTGAASAFSLLAETRGAIRRYSAVNSVRNEPGAAPSQIEFIKSAWLACLRVHIGGEIEAALA